MRPTADAGESAGPRKRRHAPRAQTSRPQGRCRRKRRVRKSRCNGARRRPPRSGHRSMRERAAPEPALALRATQRRVVGVGPRPGAARRARRGWIALDVRRTGKEFRAPPVRTAVATRSAPARRIIEPVRLVTPALPAATRQCRRHRRRRRRLRRSPRPRPTLATAATVLAAPAKSTFRRAENRQRPVRDQAMGRNPDRRQETRREPADQGAFDSGRPSSNRNPEQHVSGATRAKSTSAPEAESPSFTRSTRRSRAACAPGAGANDPARCRHDPSPVAVRG